MKSMSENGFSGYILRITTKEWVEQVYDRVKYYVGIRRKWKPGQIILFAHKTRKGDAFIGYGVINVFQPLEELTEKEKAECEKWGWYGALDFKYVKKFKEPVLIKETILKDFRLKGRLVHGFGLNSEQIESILSQAGESI